MIRTELLTHFDRRGTSLTTFVEKPKTGILLGSDIEGPFYLGDSIADAMKNKLKPLRGSVDASPSYGQIIYQQSWELFTDETLEKRRPLNADGRNRLDLSLSQEGTDTIFTLPLLLAEGADYDYLEKLTIELSRHTPGSIAFLRELEREGLFIFGITTAPQEPYRTLARRTGVLDPKRVIGSPFPIDETKNLLKSEGRWDEEISMVNSYLNDCYDIINRNSFVIGINGNSTRELSKTGQTALKDRIKKFHDEELDISYDPVKRKGRTSRTVLGQVIESTGMVGDRAKAAVAFDVYRKIEPSQRRLLITMGDGTNDVVMLKKAPFSIGINGPDAGKAAKIGVITDTMTNLLPIFELIVAGERNVDNIVREAQIRVGSNAIIHRGGSDVAPEIIEEHRKMKKQLRGQNITY